MKELWQKYQKEIIIGVIIIAVAVMLYLWGRRSANGPQVDYPEGGEGIPEGWSPEPLVAELYDAMDGLFSLSSTKDEAWMKLRDLPTDDMVVAVYNVYNQTYFRGGDGTLTQWIRDEKYYDFTTGVKDGVLARLERLGCK